MAGSSNVIAPLDLLDARGIVSRGSVVCVIPLRQRRSLSFHKVDSGSASLKSTYESLHLFVPLEDLHR